MARTPRYLLGRSRVSALATLLGGGGGGGATKFTVAQEGVLPITVADNEVEVFRGDITIPEAGIAVVSVLGEARAVGGADDRNLQANVSVELLAPGMGRLGGDEDWISDNYVSYAGLFLPANGDPRPVAFGSYAQGNVPPVGPIGAGDYTLIMRAYCGYMAGPDPAGHIELSNCEMVVALL